LAECFVVACKASPVHQRLSRVSADRYELRFSSRRFQAANTPEIDSDDGAGSLAKISELFGSTLQKISAP
jgi:hypothetical protein